MRQIGQIDNEGQARVFRAYLISTGIANDVEQTRDGRWSVWVHDETQLNRGRDELASFLLNPRGEQYQVGAQQGEQKEKEQAREENKTRTRMVDMRSQWGRRMGDQLGMLTMILIVISIGVTVAMNLPTKTPVTQWLSVTAYSIQSSMVSYVTGLPELRQGQIWRLITPIFMHFGILHIVFNMLWLRQLGSAIEATEGTWLLGAQVLLFAVLSNAGQYLVSGPSFGGMSGVVYGLFAYMWIMGKYKLTAQYQLDQTTVVMMMIWFFACLANLVGNVANTAHAVGLAAGLLWATIRVRRIPYTEIRF